MRSVRSVSVLSVLALSAVPSIASATLLDPTLNNPSFENPDIFFVANNNITNWKIQGPDIPTDNPLAGPGPVGVGMFDNPANDPETPGTDGHLENAHGAQIGYIFSHSLPDGFPTPSANPLEDHALSHVATNLTYAAGHTYKLTIAFANASTPPPEASKLTFSLFATTDPNATNGTVIAQSAQLDSSDFNGTSLEDFFIETPVIAGATIGQFIGIRITTQTTVEDLASFSGGQYVFDNVRLVPEPSTAALLGAGVLGLLSARRRRP